VARNSIKSNIAFILIATMILSCSAQVVAASTATTLEMPDYFMLPDSDIGALMPFKPAHMYNSTQNPPDFTWPRIADAEKYDLIIARDEALTDIAYSKYGLENHYYNFPHTFEPGFYYWAVRYYIGDEVSNWSTPRRFRLDVDNVEFTVPEGTAILDAFPDTHPKIWFTQDTIDEFREKTETTQGKIAKAALLASANANMKKAIPTDPGLEEQEGASDHWVSQSEARDIAITIGDQALTCAMAYILTEDTKYADFAVDCAMEVSTWNYSEGYWTAHTGNDLAFYQILLDFSYVYDWLYNYMTEAQRETFGDMLHGRFFSTSGYRKNGQILPMADYMLHVLQDNPYTSHIWSHLPDFIHCAMALSSEYPDVQDYLVSYMEFFLPNYITMCYEDGSWSKGTGYFRTGYARNNGIPETLKLSGILDMFQKPYHRNQYLFPLYMLPVKSYGSFGDEAGKSLANNIYVSQGSSEDAVFTNNPIPRWHLHVAGSYDNFLDEFDAILSAESGDMQYKVPVDHPRAWHFIDTGLTAMHSELVATDKISLYFRSGRFGSFEHMQADQNAFVIEANGERLASESGWYDSFHSNHDSGFTRKTYATNSITYDHGSGQQDDDFDADGTTRMFVTQTDFDAVVGDATEAYEGQIGNFKGA